MEKIQQKLDNISNYFESSVFRSSITNVFEPNRFYLYLTRAVIAESNGRHDEAINLLKLAYNTRPHTEDIPIFPSYQLVELCEWFYRDTKKNEYKQLAIKWAREHQVIQPFFGWAYAVEALYSDNPERKKVALAKAIFLDKRSERLSKVPVKEKEEALQWLIHNRPFSQERINDAL